MNPDSRNLPEADPYVDRPTFWSLHGAWLGPVIVAAFTALLAVLSFPPMGASQFAYVMLVPGVFWAYLRPPFKVYVATMAVAQAVAWTILLGWLHNVTWVGLLLLGPFTGIWVGTWYLAVWWTMPRMLGQRIPVRLIALLGLAAVWAIIEWTRSWLLGGFDWLPLAASQWQRISILQIAAYTGAGGVSFVLVAVNVGFAAYAHRLFREGGTGLRRRSQEFFLAMFLLLVCLSIQVQDTVNRGDYERPYFRVELVQPYIPQEVKWDPTQAPEILNVLESTTRDSMFLNPDLILWPEAVTPLAIKGDPTVRAWTESLVTSLGKPLLLGSIAVEPGSGGESRWLNGAFVVDPQTGLQPHYYAKRHLVPFGEYVPFRPVLGWIGKFAGIGGDFSPGDDPSPLEVKTDGSVLPVGMLICFEDTYPGLARESVQAGAEVLAVITNNAWFGQGGAAYQHAAHSVLRAVETRRPVIRVGNDGWSGWIDEFGNIRANLTDDNGSVYFRGSRVIDVSRDLRWVGRNSFYVEHGDWFVAVCAMIAVFAGLLLRAGQLQSSPVAPAPEGESESGES